MKVDFIKENSVAIGSILVSVRDYTNFVKVTNIIEGKFEVELRDKSKKIYALSTLKKNYRVWHKEEITSQGSTDEPQEPIVEKKSRPKKISDEDYIQAAEDFLTGVYKTRKQMAEKYSVNESIFSDMFSDKYCRKSCFNQIQELKEKYNYKKVEIEGTKNETNNN